MAEAVRAVCFPRDDHEFSARVQQLVGLPLAGEPLLAAVEALLREIYPLARVSPRHPVAALDGLTVWYVFRDGTVLPGSLSEAP
jgi:hypothetical protein